MSKNITGKARVGDFKIEGEENEVEADLATYNKVVKLAEENFTPEAIAQAGKNSGAENFSVDAQICNTDIKGKGNKISFKKNVN